MTARTELALRIYEAATLDDDGSGDACIKVEAAEGIVEVRTEGDQTYFGQATLDLPPDVAVALGRALMMAAWEARQPADEAGEAA